MSDITQRMVGWINNAADGVGLAANNDAGLDFKAYFARTEPTERDGGNWISIRITDEEDMGRSSSRDQRLYESYVDLYISVPDYGSVAYIRNKILGYEGVDVGSPETFQFDASDFEVVTKADDQRFSAVLELRTRHVETYS